MPTTIQYRGAQTAQEIQAILALQQANLARNISPAEVLEQGFVTVEHDLDLLAEMNHPYGHTIAKADAEVAGYVLTMTPAFRERIPVLEPMFALFEQLTWQGRSVADINYVVMGQVCVAKAFRGQGVFAGLYHSMQERMAPHFELIITEISARNPRSLRAHAKVGFTEMHHFQSPDGEQWVVVGLETRRK
ncbi:MAG: GNAT family N-acetyltransferase [Bacteroidetes bacterium]|nr:MAG: GNAT family N-acetyltransferase [Bacteroidota bacterium]PTM12757.1 MAG: GNAT family N-acetyltransferase [Bacteroidota bacterium]